jgi:hypothetical protein
MQAFLFYCYIVWLVFATGLFLAVAAWVGM